MANPDRREVYRPNSSIGGSENSQPALDLHEITADEIMGIAKRTIVRLRQFEATIKPSGNTLLSWFEQEVTHESAAKLAQVIGINIHTLLSIAKRYGIPTLSQTEAVKLKWQDPEFRGMRSRQVSAEWQNPDYAARRVEGLKARWQDPEYRKRQANGIKVLNIILKWT